MPPSEPDARLQPSKVGTVRGPQFGLPLDAPLAPVLCPECPWRKTTTLGYPVAFPSGFGTMALTTNLHHLGAQGCHMVEDQRCRGAEHFRANTGRSAEVQPSSQVMTTAEAAYAMWEERGARGVRWIGSPGQWAQIEAVFPLVIDDRA